MKTDDLIALMAASQTRVASGRLGRGAVMAAGAGALASAALVALILRPRPDLAAALAGPVLGKALFGLAIALSASATFLRSLRPGVEAAGALKWIAAPAVAVALLAALQLSYAAPAQWGALALGRNWMACLVAVPAFALIPLGALFLVARGGAPVDARLTGASAGLAAAGLAIVGYSLHCPDDAAPFVAVWYSLATAAAGLIGAGLGPRLLRW